MTNWKLTVVKAAILLAAVPVLVLAHDYGPDAGVTGVPGEDMQDDGTPGTCNQSSCHTGTPINGGGSVSINFPNGLSYAPGVKQHLVVTIDDSAQKRWGFQASARLAGDATQMAGSFSPTDMRTQLICDIFADLGIWNRDRNITGLNAVCPASLPLAYIEHTKAGYLVTQPNPGTYEFDWSPPSSDVGPVTFFIAANAANGDDAETGDHIYTATYTLTTGSGTPPATSSCPSGPPAITAVQNGASSANNIQQLSYVQIKGSNLACTSRQWQSSDFVNGKLPVQLDDVSVTIDGKPAILYALVDSTLIKAIAPATATIGPVSVVVSNAGGTSNTFQAQMQAYSPGFFPWGKYPFATRTSDNTWIAPPAFFGPLVMTVSAKPGDTIALFGTGFGLTNPAAPTDVVAPDTPAFNLKDNPTVNVGGVAAQVVSASLVKGTAGLYQIVIQMPNVPDGDQPLQVTIGGQSIPDGMFLSVHQ